MNRKIVQVIASKPTKGMGDVSMGYSSRDAMREGVLANLASDKPSRHLRRLLAAIRRPKRLR